MQWHPAETAPKDRTFLAFAPDPIDGFDVSDTRDLVHVVWFEPQAGRFFEAHSEDFKFEQWAEITPPDMGYSTTK